MCQQRHPATQWHLWLRSLSQRLLLPLQLRLQRQSLLPLKVRPILTLSSSVACAMLLPSMEVRPGLVSASLLHIPCEPIAQPVLPPVSWPHEATSKAASNSRAHIMQVQLRLRQQRSLLSPLRWSGPMVPWTLWRQAPSIWMLHVLASSMALTSGWCTSARLRASKSFSGMLHTTLLA